MPTYIDPKFVHVEPRGKGGAVAAVLVAAAVVFAVVEIVTSEAFAVAVDVAVGVVSALCVAGAALVVRELRQPSLGPLWRPAKQVRALPVPEVNAAAPMRAIAAAPLAIEAPSVVHYHLHVTSPVSAADVAELVARQRNPQTAIEEHQ